MDDGLQATIDEGRGLFERGEWAAARDLLATVLDAGEPEALDTYGQALWFLGDIAGALDWRERACVGFGERDDCDTGARVAAWLARQYQLTGRGSLARGWLARAERALDGHPDCAGTGWVAIERARGGDPLACIDGAGRALAIGRAAGDGDLEVFALSLLGRAEVEAGRFEAGMAHLEEAMAGALAGRVRNPHTLGEAYCNMIGSATSAGDWERAAEWCALVDDYAQRLAIVPLFGACRVTHADVLLASGRLDDAEEALVGALDAFARHNPLQGEPAIPMLAQLRIRQGRLAEAETLLAGREEQPHALLALALLRLAEGEPVVAAGLLERALAGTGNDVLVTSRLLVPLIDAHLAGDDQRGAEAALARLAEIAELSGRPLIRAHVQLAEARLALAGGRPEDAHEAARLALESFGRLGMPHEVAEARLELARSLAGEIPALAVEEARAARSAFRELGAARSADIAAAVLRELGAGSAPGPRGDGRELTERERQVLALLARGLTNAQIGERLYISEKTAGHHVSRIFGKLGARNRAEAAARARVELE